MVRTHRQSAQAVVELAIAMPVLLFFALGTLDFGRVFHTYIGLTNAAREGARRATLLAPDCGASTLSAVRAAVRAEQSDLFPSTGPDAVPDAVITLDCSAGDRRQVMITAYPFRPIVPLNWFDRIANPSLPPTATLGLTTWATMPVVNQ